MDFELTDRCKEYQERVSAFMDERIYPAEPVYEEQMRGVRHPHFHPPILEELKDEARSARAVEPLPPAPGVGTRASPTPSTRRWPRSWAAASSSPPRR